MIDWVQLISSFFGTLGFALLFHLRGKRAFWTTLGGFAAWFVYLVLEPVFPSYGVRFLLAGMGLGFYSEVMAIRTKMPRTAYIAVGIIPLIPGAALYKTMYNFFQRESSLTTSYALEAVITSMSIAAGLLLAMTIWKVARRMKNAKVF